MNSSQTDTVWATIEIIKKLQAIRSDVIRGSLSKASTDTVTLKQITKDTHAVNFMEQNPSKEGNYPVLTAGRSYILGYTNKEGTIHRDKDVVLFDDFSTESRFVDFPFAVRAFSVRLIYSKDESKVSTRFIHELIRNIDFDINGVFKRRWISEYANMLVELPDRIEQDEILRTVDIIDRLIFDLEIRLPNPPHIFKKTKVDKSK